jgi:gas vesicle protein
MKNDGFKILSGFFIGAIGGLLTGILIAPESGKDTRKKISDTANKIKDDLSEFADETLEATKKSISETIDELLENGKEQSKKILKN